MRVGQSFPIDQINDKDFTLRVRGTIESPTVTQGASSDRTSGTSSVETKVAGQIRIDTWGYFRDADSGILNTGPFPPEVNVNTDYTIHWALINFSTDVDEIEVRAKLEDGVSFTGEVKSNIDTVPEIDQATNEVVWRVGSLRATEDVLNTRPEAVFQLKATPTSSMVEQFMPLVGITSVSAKDTSTGAALSNTDNALTTRLPDDGTISNNEGKVITENGN